MMSEHPPHHLTGIKGLRRDKFDERRFLRRRSLLLRPSRRALLAFAKIAAYTLLFLALGGVLFVASQIDRPDALLSARPPLDHPSLLAHKRSDGVIEIRLINTLNLPVRAHIKSEYWDGRFVEEVDVSPSGEFRFLIPPGLGELRIDYRAFSLRDLYAVEVQSRCWSHLSGVDCVDEQVHYFQSPQTK